MCLCLASTGAEADSRRRFQHEPAALRRVLFPADGAAFRSVVLENDVERFVVERAGEEGALRVARADGAEVLAPGVEEKDVVFEEDGITLVLEREPEARGVKVLVNAWRWA
jgi:predicted ribosome-associated RNA-binding protein Tma20